MDVAHGHPPSLSSRSDSRNPPTSHRSNTNLSTRRCDAPFSLQKRRLQLRNVGFRGPKVSSQRLGVKTSRFFHAPDVAQSEALPLRDQENTPPQKASTHSPRSGDRSSATLHVLQEISNSTRSRHSQKPSDIPIAEDQLEPRLVDTSPAASTAGPCCHDAFSTQPSPVNVPSTDADLDMIKLREISGNKRRSPASLRSPLAPQVRGRKKQGAYLRKTTFEA